MRNSTLLNINGLVFMMGCNKTSPVHIGKCMFFTESLTLHLFQDFCFLGKIYHFIVKIVCLYQNVHYHYPQESIHIPLRLTNSPPNGGIFRP